ncbi:hypothetical protein Pelo_10209, partial [Pelomyxa schiedti]
MAGGESLRVAASVLANAGSRLDKCTDESFRKLLGWADVFDKTIHGGGQTTQDAAAKQYRNLFKLHPALRNIDLENCTMRNAILKILLNNPTMSCHGLVLVMKEYSKSTRGKVPLHVAITEDCYQTTNLAYQLHFLGSTCENYLLPKLPLPRQEDVPASLVPVDTPTSEPFVTPMDWGKANSSSSAFGKLLHSELHRLAANYTSSQEASHTLLDTFETNLTEQLASVPRVEIACVALCTAYSSSFPENAVCRHIYGCCNILTRCLCSAREHLWHINSQLLECTCATSTTLQIVRLCP